MTTRFNPTVELYYDDQWNDITTDVRVQEGISITRGRADEGGRVDPGRCQLTLDNTGGKYSPRNPTSPLYGKIGRNTPIRVTMGTPTGTPATVASDTFTRTETNGWGTSDTGQVWRQLDGASGAASERAVNGSAATLTHSAIPNNYIRLDYLDVSLADCEVLVSLTVNQVATGGPYLPGVMLRFTTGVDYYRCLLELDVDQSIELSVTRRSTQVGPDVPTGLTYTAGGKLWLRARVESTSSGDRIRGRVWNDGSAEPGTWQLDYTLTEALVPSGAVGVSSGTSSTNTNVNPVYTWDSFTAYDLGSDDHRFVGEVANWPVKWDVSGKDIWTPIEANGIMRRLGQGASPLRSPLYRELTAAGRARPIAYWPLEDEEGATTLASAVGGRPMEILGEPQLAAFSDFVCSAPVPTMGSAYFTGVVDPYEDTGLASLRFMLNVPSGGLTDGQRIANLYASGNAHNWQLRYHTGGALSLRCYNPDGVLLLDTGMIGFAVNGVPWNIGIELTQNGANIDWRFFTIRVDVLTTSYSDWAGTLVGETFGTVQRITMAPDRGLTEAAIGHVLFGNRFDLIQGTRMLVGWSGERAGVRMRRLCVENGVPFLSYHDVSETEELGHQKIDTVVAILEDAAEADGGLFQESRSQIGLTYRPRVSLYNQAPAATLDYSAGDVSPPFEPVEDDANVRNDITVKRSNGSSVRVIKESGPLSVQPPPNGVGRYDEEVDLNLFEDSRLGQQASWRVHLSTYDEPRYPSVTVDLAKNPSLIDAVSAVDSGDRLVVTNPPSWLPGDDIELLAQGYTERFDEFWWTWTANCSPGGPWLVFELGDPVLGRLATGGSSLAQPIGSTDTTILVATDSGKRLWITTAIRPGDFPFCVTLGGEVLRVEAISGNSSPQTFTVVRSHNGVIKSHPSGTRIQIARMAP